MTAPLKAEQQANGEWWLLRDYQPCPLYIANFGSFKEICEAAAEYLNRDHDWLMPPEEATP